MTYLLMLWFMTADGKSEVQVIPNMSYEECEYTRAVLENDYAHYEWDLLKQSMCLEF